jgi:hypothetical protein
MANAAAKLISRAEVWVEPELKDRIDQWPNKPGGMRRALDLYDRLQKHPVLLSQVELELVSREHGAERVAG